MFDKNGYYNTNKVKSYGTRFCVVLSERGIGKTYGEKKAMVKEFWRHGNQFACIFRTGADLLASLSSWLDPFTAPSFLDKMPPISPDRFKWIPVGKGGSAVNLEIDGKIAGYFRCLANANAVKYETFPLKIKWVMFDEFAPIAWKKLPGIENEGEALENIIDTMDHDSRHRKADYGYPPVRCVMFANPRNRISPLYDYFSIPALKFGCYKVNKDVACEQIKPTETNTEGGLSDNARKCRAYLDADSFVRRVPKGARPLISVRVVDHYYLLLQDAAEHIYVVRKRHHANGCSWYFGSLDRLTERERCLDSKTSNGTILDVLLRNIANGALYYESIETKYAYINDLDNC